jgi:hypothetical protein
MRSLRGLVLCLLAPAAWADTPGVYHPYVNAYEREVEVAFARRDGRTLQSLSLGYAWNERVSTELYLLREFATHSGPRAQGHELEVTVQLTEPGEFASDWGLLFEAADANGLDHHELAAGVLWERALPGRWVAAANVLVEYEFGDDVDAEFEAALRAQLRYRAGPALEPAIELYLDDLDHAIGPSLQGTWRLAPRRQLRWQAGVFLGLDATTPDSVRAALELEF